MRKGYPNTEKKRRLVMQECVSISIIHWLISRLLLLIPFLDFSLLSLFFFLYLSLSFFASASYSAFFFFASLGFSWPPFAEPKMDL